MELRDFIRTERTKAGLSQRGLAKLLDVSPGAVGQWESGTTKPELWRLIDMCTRFGVSAQPLLGPGGPYAGELVQDAEELSLLAFWRRLDPSGKALVRRLVYAERRDVIDHQQPPKAAGETN